jgi:hypothetical protein
MRIFWKRHRFNTGVQVMKTKNILIQMILLILGVCLIAITTFLIFPPTIAIILSCPLGMLYGSWLAYKYS